MGRAQWALRLGSTREGVRDPGSQGPPRSRPSLRETPQHQQGPWWQKAATSPTARLEAWPSWTRLWEPRDHREPLGEKQVCRPGPGQAGSGWGSLPLAGTGGVSGLLPLLGGPEAASGMTPWPIQSRQEGRPWSRLHGPEGQEGYKVPEHGVGWVPAGAASSADTPQHLRRCPRHRQASGPGAQPCWGQTRVSSEPGIRRPDGGPRDPGGAA